MLRSRPPVQPKLLREIALSSMKKLRLRKKWSHLGELELEPASSRSQNLNSFHSGVQPLTFYPSYLRFQFGNVLISRLPSFSCPKLLGVAVDHEQALGSAWKMLFIIWLAKEPQVKFGGNGNKVACVLHLRQRQALLLQLGTTHLCVLVLSSAERKAILCRKELRDQGIRSYLWSAHSNICFFGQLMNRGPWQFTKIKHTETQGSKKKRRERVLLSLNGYNLHTIKAILL